MRTVFAVLLFVSLRAFSQPGTNNVFDAENKFAAYAVQHGTRAAFLQFADSTAVVFENGRPVNAIATWTKREARAGILNCHPAFGLVSVAGDLGFTTGPWTFQPKTVNDSVVARGQYNTVWHKTTGGEWKFLLDLGVNSAPGLEHATLTMDGGKNSFSPGTLTDLQAAENLFTKQTSLVAQRATAYVQSISERGFVVAADGQVPATNIEALKKLVSARPDSIQYSQQGAGIAGSGDLGFVYGQWHSYGRSSNYLRVWQRQGSKWKLVLEALP